MKGMSEREYAAHSGLSRGGVQKARKNGRLVVHDDGSINAAASDVRRAEMRFVPVKSEEAQGSAMVFRIRALLIRQRTQAINALRGHLGARAE